MNIRFFLTFFMYVPIISYCSLYQYPVAYFFPEYAHNPQLLVAQQDNNTITAWLCDIKSHTQHSILSAFYVPANMVLLPDKTGFSFIDHDHIRIKYFEKRNPKTVEFCRPLYDISTISWIDAQHYYFSAREHKHFGIYHATIDGCCFCLRWISEGDCLYPNKIDSSLFFIERDQAGNYCFASMEYPEIDWLQEKLCCVSHHHNKAIPLIHYLIDFDEQPIAFLSMYAADQGFVIQYPKHLNQEVDLIVFSYIHLYKDHNRWQWKKLFTFSLPWKLLFDDKDRLYESIIPLLPHYKGTQIYFVNADENNGQLKLQSFDMNSQSIKIVGNGSPYDVVYQLGLIRVGMECVDLHY